ncbi:MAG: [acyl-carrier-protein] S-malonyltransferase, partial [Planctomycetota bacterium]
LDIDVLTGLCHDARTDDEVLRPANLLCPGNIAVSGHDSALQRLTQPALDAGAMKVVPLPVAGAFHTPLMQPAVAALTEALAEMNLAETDVPVFSNVDASPHSVGDEFRSLLGSQVTQPVLWEKSIRSMIDAGCDGFMEIGCGKVLRGTIRRVDRKFPTDGFGDGL